MNNCIFTSITLVIFCLSLNNSHANEFGVVWYCHQRVSFEYVQFEVPFRHTSKDIKWVIRYMGLDFRREVGTAR